NQTASFNTYETRPYVGVRLKWDTSWHGIRLISYTRFEARFQTNLTTDETKTERELRSRIQALVPINTRHLSEDRTWYAIVDAEWFWTAGGDEVSERFQSDRRYRVGIGWRRNSKWSYQFIYTLQKS